MNSLQVQTLKLEPAKIEFNYEDIEKDLENKLKHYEGLVFTEENTKELRATLAELRKGKTAVDNYRKEIKKELTQPVTEFENKCKSLNKHFDEVINPLKKQLDEYEEKRKEDKRFEINKLIEEITKEYELDYEFACKLTVENDMLAKSRSMKSIEDTLTFKATHLKTEQESREKDVKLVESNVKALNAEHGTDFNTQAYTSLLEFEDVDSVLEKMKNHILAEVKKREEEEKRKLEELKKQEEEKEKEEKLNNFKREQELEQHADYDMNKNFEDVSFDEPEEIPFSDDFMPDPFADEERKVSYIVTANDQQHDKLVEVLFNLGVEWSTNE